MPVAWQELTDYASDHHGLISIDAVETLEIPQGQITNSLYRRRAAEVEQLSSLTRNVEPERRQNGRDQGLARKP